jgi:hypothetical protein
MRLTSAQDQMGKVRYAQDSNPCCTDWAVLLLNNKVNDKKALK